jgi:hypothetical protein
MTKVSRKNMKFKYANWRTSKTPSDARLNGLHVAKIIINCPNRDVKVDKIGSGRNSIRHLNRCLRQHFEVGMFMQGKTGSALRRSHRAIPQE